MQVMMLFPLHTAITLRDAAMGFGFQHLRMLQLAELMQGSISARLGTSLQGASLARFCKQMSSSSSSVCIKPSV